MYKFFVFFRVDIYGKKRKYPDWKKRKAAAEAFALQRLENRVISG